MTRTYNTLLMAVALSMAAPPMAQGQLYTPGTGVTDVDGHTYPSVILGTQEWMAANLRTTRYADGLPIPHVVANFQWQNLAGPAWCHFDNNADFEVPHGKLYSALTLQGDHKLCPAGWHLPSEAEWNIVAKHLDPQADTTCTNCTQSTTAGGLMKSTGTDHWLSPNEGATNESGLEAHGGGSRNANGTFSSLSQSAWWSNTESNPETGFRWYRQLRHNNAGLYRFASGHPRQAFYVRCVKDINTTQTGSVRPNTDLLQGLHPNPATHEVYFTLAQPAQILLRDVQGRTVATHAFGIGTHRLAVSTLPPGVYVLVCQGAQGTAVARLVRR